MCSVKDRYARPRSAAAGVDLAVDEVGSGFAGVAMGPLASLQVACVEGSSPFAPSATIVRSRGVCSSRVTAASGLVVTAMKEALPYFQGSALVAGTKR